MNPPTEADYIEFLNSHIDAHNMTVSQYLDQLLIGILDGTMDAKYGLSGNTDWRYDLYNVLRDLGHIPHWNHGDGLDEATERAADNFIIMAIYERGRATR